MPQYEGRQKQEQTPLKPPLELAEYPKALSLEQISEALSNSPAPEPVTTTLPIVCPPLLLGAAGLGPLMVQQRTHAPHSHLCVHHAWPGTGRTGRVNRHASLPSPGALGIVTVESDSLKTAVFIKGTVPRLTHTRPLDAKFTFLNLFWDVPGPLKSLIISHTGDFTSSHTVDSWWLVINPIKILVNREESGSNHSPQTQA